MGTRGRTSVAALTAPAAVGPVETVARLRAPHDLTDEETEVWAAVVESHPADWFDPSTAPMLGQYCRHVIHARRVAELIERAVGNPELAIKDYDRLLKMQERESRAIASLATKMRIAQQSTRTHRGNAAPATLEKPWDDE